MSSALVSTALPTRRCLRCSEPTKRFITKTSNRNGNAGRPYYKCVACGKFAGFDDERGDDPNNPLCDCGRPSKRQVAGIDKTVPRGLHYVCRLRACDFYMPHTNQEGDQLSVDDSELLARMIRLKIV